MAEPAKMCPYEPTESMRWAAKRIDPALSHEQIRALWAAMWSATPQADRCQHCDETGDVHDQTGEWRGVCNCNTAESQWQPIETAPKDGTFILIWRNHRGGEVLQACWYTTIFGEKCWGGPGWSIPNDCGPTHWMPRPSAPNTDKKDDTNG